MADWRLDLHLTIPAGLHDASDTDRIITITLVDLHGQGSPGVAGINTDHR